MYHALVWGNKECISGTFERLPCRPTESKGFIIVLIYLKQNNCAEHKLAIYVNKK